MSPLIILLCLIASPENTEDFTKVAKDTEGGRNFWAFVPPYQYPVPDVTNGTWCRAPIDRFILARMDDADLALSAGSPVASRC